jgi:hypothetical protein
MISNDILIEFISYIYEMKDLDDLINNLPKQLYNIVYNILINTSYYDVPVLDHTPT